MIPIEVLWIALIGVFGIIGMTRGIWKEVGATAILLLSLFTLFILQELIVGELAGVLTAQLPSDAPENTDAAIYYIAIVVFVAFISYQGVVLEFPVKRQTGPIKWIFGILGGLVNGYLVVGTVWNAVADAAYFGIDDIATSLTPFHQTMVEYLPLSLMDSQDLILYAFLAAGMVLLLVIVLK
jgi:uncharacterized membrane protein required for colicin V production